MKDISDNEFDRIFQEKSQNFDYEFEEEAWVLMEKKLREKDRIIFLRNFSIAAALLLFLGIGLYFFAGEEQPIIAKKTIDRDSINLAANTHTNLGDSNTFEDKRGEAKSITSKEKGILRSVTPEMKTAKIQKHYSSKSDYRNKKGLDRKGLLNSQRDNRFEISITDNATANSSSLAHVELVHALGHNELTYSDLTLGNKQQRPSLDKTSDKPELKLPSKPRLSFTFSAGPDFSSTRGLAGKRGNLNAGLLLNVDFKRFSLSTGARYGIKKYDAEALDYALKNPARAKEIYNIDASCNVLEIPLQLSVTAKSWANKKLSINAGLSSYLMLKEKYLFEYTPESGVNDFLLKKTNANQSYLGVASFSARYNFKPTNQNIRFGIEPYVKLPLGGVGEGKVKLKSSGISLTMTYGITKKH